MWVLPHAALTMHTPSSAFTTVGTCARHYSQYIYIYIYIYIYVYIYTYVYIYICICRSLSEPNPHTLNRAPVTVAAYHPRLLYRKKELDLVCALGGVEGKLVMSAPPPLLSCSLAPPLFLSLPLYLSLSLTLCPECEEASILRLGLG